MDVDVTGLKEQAEYLNSCLERLRSNMGNFPDVGEARWLEMMMISSLSALENHIRQLESLKYRSSLQNTLFKT